jgi:uncharacterized protein YcaQ
MLKNRSKSKHKHMKHPLTKPEVISLDDAQDIIVKAQLLHQYTPLGSSEAAAAEIIQQLGYVQIDTIAVVERAHHHVFWSRDERYRPAIIDTLQRSGQVFEYWTHAMSYIPMTDYRYYLPKMQNFRSVNHAWFKIREARSRAELQYVLDRVRQEGPLAAKDFENTRTTKSSGWWDWKPAKDALEFLLWQGELMVAARKNFQKLYDIPGRVIPSQIDTSSPSEAETALFIVRRALRALGLMSRQDAQCYLQPAGTRDTDLRACSAEAIDAALATICESGEAKVLGIATDPSTKYYVAPEVLAGLGPKKCRQELHILSPFDHLVIKRERLARLFGFNYTIECYVPEAKRIYGYFSLPLLYGLKFIGRVDIKTDRKTKTLILRHLHLEKKSTNEALLESFAVKMRHFAQFNGVEAVVIDRSNCPAFATALAGRLLGRE